MPVSVRRSDRDLTATEGMGVEILLGLTVALQFPRQRMFRRMFFPFVFEAGV